jgi:hypothetical protein
MILSILNNRESSIGIGSLIVYSFGLAQGPHQVTLCAAQSNFIDHQNRIVRFFDADLIYTCISITLEVSNIQELPRLDTNELSFEAESTLIHHSM